MKIIATILCLSAALHGQSLHITASTLSPADVHALFGPLRKNYGAARVDICSSSPDAVTIPLGKIRQQVKLTNGVAILSNTEALSVIARAQSTTKVAIGLRYGLAAVQLAAIASTWSGLSATIKNTLTSSAVAGGGLLTVVGNAATVNSMVSYSSVALPETLQILPQGCAPTAIELLEFSKSGIMEPASIDFLYPLQSSKGTTP
jgi:hypothetical protein